MNPPLDYASFQMYVYSRLEKAVFAVEVLSHDDDFLPFLLWRISCSHEHSLAHFWETSLQLVFRQVYYNMSGMTTKKSSDGSNRNKCGNNIQGKNFLFIYSKIICTNYYLFDHDKFDEHFKCSGIKLIHIFTKYEFQNTCK